MKSLLTNKTLFFAFLILCSVSASGKDGNSKRLKAEGLVDLVAAYRRLQFVSPPVSDGKSRTHDIGLVEFSPGKGEWPVALAANLVQGKSADGRLCWPFSIYENPVTHDIHVGNGDGRVIYTLEPDADYDQEWVFRCKFRIGQDARKAQPFERFKNLFAPSRVVMTGRLVPAVEPDAQETALKGSMDPLTPAAPISVADIELQPNFTPLAMQDAPVMSGISAEDPGSPPTGYKDGLYLQQGTNGVAYLIRMEQNLRSIARASSSSLLLFSDGSVVGVGYDPLTYDPCGPSTVPPVNAVFSLPEDMTGVTTITADFTNYFLFLMGDGHVRGWGQENNACGRGDVPASVTNAISLVAGAMHAVALLEGGRVVQWGESSLLPSSVTNVKAIAAGGTTTLALLQNGAVVEWECGSTNATSESASVTNAIAVAAGFSHSLALLGDGRVMAWGDNYCGEIDVPACVTNAVAVAAGWYHSMALLTNGEIVVWGDNSCGQTNIPDSATNAVAIYAVDSQCHALLPDGSAVVWGGWATGGCPQQPLDTLGTNGLCRILQTAYSEDAGDGLLLGVARVPDDVFTDGWPTNDVVAFAGGLTDDADGDGLSLFDETRHGTDPANPDSDDDGLNDGDETTAPFLTLWDPSDPVGRAFFGCDAAQVTASDTARAARLTDGRVIIFTGSSTNMLVYTNDCGAATIDATDSWIAATLTNGNVKIWREVAGGLSEFSLGSTNAVEISGGLSHLLVRYANGKVSCLKPNSSTGVPEIYTSSFCADTSITNAIKISAGSSADAILLANKSFRFGDALTSSSSLETFTGTPTPIPLDVAAGSDEHYVILFSNGWVNAYEEDGRFSSTRTLSENGVVKIAAGGDTQLLAILSNGTNALFTTGGSSWSLTADSNDLLNARDIWWRRNSRMSVSQTGLIEVLQNATDSGMRLDFHAVAVTPGGLARGIAMATSGTSPHDTDSDGDHIPDGWEIVHGFNPGDTQDGNMDSDSDGLTNYGEYLNNTDPYDPDSDDDAYLDGWEVANNFNPRDPSDTGADPDGDGLTNAREKILGTNKDSKDTDGDGLSDGAETEVPFPMLWDSSGDTGISLTNLFVLQVTASDTARAARLKDGRVIIFTGSSTNMLAYTNDCEAVEEIDATDAWIAARLADGNVKIWREIAGGLSEFSLGSTNAVEISGGLRHLLVRYKDGKVACLKPNTSTGVPEVYTSSFCAGVTTAKRISAGSVADAILLTDNSFRFGDALTTSSTTKTFTGTPTPVPIDVAAGTNKNYVILFSNGVATAYKQLTSDYKTSAGVVAISAAGDAQLLAVFSNGSNAVFTTGGTSWNYTQVTNNLLTARDLWWRRNCRLAVYESGTLVPMQNATGSVRRLEFFSVSVTPGGLARGIAAACAGTCPTNSDTDADELLDGWEAANGFNPRDPSDAFLDTDADSMPDWWEIMNGFNRFAGSDATADADGDMVSNALECARGTDPRNPASVNRTLYVDSDIGSNTYDGYWSYLRSYGRGPKAGVQQMINASVSGDVIELRGAPAFADRTLNTGGKDIILVPVGSVRF